MASKKQAVVAKSTPDNEPAAVKTSGAAKKPVARKPAAEPSSTTPKAPAAKKPSESKKPSDDRHATPDKTPEASAWTPAELRAIEAELHLDALRLGEELASAEMGLADLIRDSGDGAGDDQADAGSKTFEREHEMSLANNARDMLLQVEHALGRIEAGTYGQCETCGQPIGKHRLQAFPRATMCLACKQAEER